MRDPVDAIPDFQSLMLPVLQASSLGEVRIGDVVARIAEAQGLSNEQRAALLPSGRQTTFANRVHWAKSYLGKAGLIELTRRAHFQITPRGREVLVSMPDRIDINYLRRFPEFEQFRFSGADSSGPIATLAAGVTGTPDEEMRRARDRINRELADQMLERILAASPAFFEQLVVKLVTAMGYGGSVEDAGRALGQSGDDGVDGVIDEDALGLDRIYVQAKRYQIGNSVGPGAVRDFFGALDQFKAGKGLFVTTSSFTSSAKSTAQGLSKRIVLVDGKRLMDLMIRYDVGCRVEEVLAIKRLDEDFFDA